MAGHIPVLLEESIEGLSIKEDGVYLDLTLGRGGHGEAILRKLSPKGRLIAFDLDQTAIDEGRERLSKVGGDFLLIHDNFASFPEHLGELGIGGVDGILADLGVSSPQFDDGERGFSYRFDAPLDMRMDVGQTLSAREVVNCYSLAELTRVIGVYGEEKGAYRIARSIIASRPIETTFQLVEAIKKAKSAKELSAKEIGRACRWTIGR